MSHKPKYRIGQKVITSDLRSRERGRQPDKPEGTGTVRDLFAPYGRETPRRSRKPPYFVVMEDGSSTWYDEDELRPFATPKKQNRLLEDVFVTTIHGITGREIDEGELAAGTLIRKISSEEREDGLETSFEASTDGGKHWYKCKTFDEVVIAGQPRLPGWRFYLCQTPGSCEAISRRVPPMVMKDASMLRKEFQRMAERHFGAEEGRHYRIVQVKNDEIGLRAVGFQGKHIALKHV